MINPASICGIKVITYPGRLQTLYLININSTEGCTLIEVLFPQQSHLLAMKYNFTMNETASCKGLNDRGFKKQYKYTNQRSSFCLCEEQRVHSCHSCTRMSPRYFCRFGHIYLDTLYTHRYLFLKIAYPYSNF